jgi:hypothetical protein
MMTEPQPLVFGADWDEVPSLDGAPLVELVDKAFVGRCQLCGLEAEEQEDGSVLVRAEVIDGTLYGDTFCVGCIDRDTVPGPTLVLPPLAEDEEGGE